MTGYQVDPKMEPMNGDGGRPLANNACAQGFHDVCDSPVPGGAGGMVHGPGVGAESRPCECPHHAEARRRRVSA